MHLKTVTKSDMPPQAFAGRAVREVRPYALIYVALGIYALLVALDGSSSRTLGR